VWVAVIMVASVATWAFDWTGSKSEPKLRFVPVGQPVGGPSSTAPAIDPATLEAELVAPPEGFEPLETSDGGVYDIERLAALQSEENRAPFRAALLVLGFRGGFLRMTSAPDQALVLEQFVFAIDLPGAAAPEAAEGFARGVVSGSPGESFAVPEIPSAAGLTMVQSHDGQDVHIRLISFLAAARIHLVIGFDAGGPVEPGVVLDVAVRQFQHG